MSTDTELVPAAELSSFLVRLFKRTGMNRSGARTLAAALVEADLRGIPGHGSRLAPGLAAKLCDGRLNPRPVVTTLHTGTSVAAMDADLAPGPVAARHAVSAAAHLARRTGTALVTVRRTGHAGALGIPAGQLARRGLIGLVAAQTSGRSVAVLGGPGTVLLGNPALAVAVPAAGPRPPALVDLASASMSWGRVHQHEREQRPLPPGTALDQHGQPTTDPTAAAALLPSGPRAQGLAIVLELLVGALTGGSALPDGGEGRGLLCLAIDPTRLGSGDELTAAVADVSTALAEHRARLPGERAFAHRAQAAAHGVPVDRADLDRLIAAGAPAVRPPSTWIRTTR
ncbi:Ldh family oxidoreductase [Kitasatospora sp. NPDC088134]|uniref:Ldh family oxidoreductase n=1 Tax=Kitasatospora sp. NPDC088134 TaxID=3364071 RepID=UPI00380BF340